MKSIVNLWFLVAVVFVTEISTDTITPVEQCPGESFDNLQEKIQVTPCDKIPCRLPQGTNITVVIKFTPEKEVKTLSNAVSALVGGIPFPFFGMTGTNACGDVKYADTGAPASCPLAAGQEYVYSNVFPVLPVYPTWTMRVHWHLHDGDYKVICFEVPATITKGPKAKKLMKN